MKAKFTLIILIVVSISISAQDFQYSGYFDNVNSVWAMKNNPDWALDETVTNRLNFSYFLGNFTLHAGLRNIWEFGDFIRLIPNYGNYLTTDAGYFNLTRKITSEKSYILYTNLDRLFFDYSSDKFEITLGRQRINLAENMVWNPNDIFNAYNYYNFTYVEKPGSDAAKIEYFLGDVSSLQAALKVDRNKKVTAAGILKFNKWNYDFQFFGGIMPDDYVLGGGWAGEIYDAGFSGEATYFKSKDENASEKSRFLFSVEGNYTFTNGFYIDGSVLFNNRGTTGKAGLNSAVFREDLNVKYLTPAKISLFAEAAYPITPLVRGTLSSIFNPYDKSYYFGGMLRISLTENIDFNIAGQFFNGDSGTEFGQIGSFLFSQLKWNF